MFKAPLKICAIAAMDQERVIGLKNAIPWKIPEDMKRFASLTTPHTVLMGRKTFDSLPDTYRPLPRRKNVVVSRNPNAAGGNPSVEVCSSPTEFIESCRRGDIVLPTNELWIIGGERIYRETVEYWQEVHLTLVKSRHEGDTYLVRFEDLFKLVSCEDHDEFAFLTYTRR